MPAKLDLPDKEIVKLVDEHMLSYLEIKERLNLNCSVDTIGRHYRKFKKRAAGECKKITDTNKSWWKSFKDWLSRLF